MGALRALWAQAAHPQFAHEALLVAQAPDLVVKRAAQPPLSGLAELETLVDRGSQNKHRTAPVPIGAIDPTTHIRRSG